MNRKEELKQEIKRLEDESNIYFYKIDKNKAKVSALWQEVTKIEEEEKQAQTNTLNIKNTMTIDLGRHIKIVKAEEEVLEFSDGSKLYSKHDLDCCEYNYADFTCLLDTHMMDMPFMRLTIEPCEYGFKLNGYLVNCYSDQNGYYSSTLDLCYKYFVEDSEKEITLLKDFECDLRDC